DRDNELPAAEATDDALRGATVSDHPAAPVSVFLRLLQSARSPIEWTFAGDSDNFPGNDAQGRRVRVFVSAGRGRTDTGSLYDAREFELFPNVRGQRRRICDQPVCP